MSWMLTYLGVGCPVLVHEVGWGADDVLYELWEGGVVRHGGVVHPPPRHLQGVFHVVPDIVPEKVGKSSKTFLSLFSPIFSPSAL